MKSEFLSKSAAALPYPQYRFHYPRPEYSVDPSPYYDFGLSDTDEAIITNGTISTSMTPNGLHNGYVPSQLWRFNAPPFTLGEKGKPILHLWGFDEEGHHQVRNTAYVMDYSLKGLKAHVDEIQWEGNTNPNWTVDLEYNTLPEKRVIVATITYTNVSAKHRSLKLAGHLRDPQITYSLGWTQYTPDTGNINASYHSQTGFGAIETSSVDNNAFLVFGLSQPSDSYSVTADDEFTAWSSHGIFSGADSMEGASAHNQYLSSSLGVLAPAQSASVSFVMAISGSLSAAREDFTDTILNLSQRLEEAEQYWVDRWNETKYEILTPEADINRMSEIAMSNGILGLDRVNEVWIASFGRAYRGVTFIWDQNYSNYGYLVGGHPAEVKKALINSLNLDLTTYNFYGNVVKNSLGYHYSYSHYSITSLAYKYVSLTGDTDFLNERLANGHRVIECLSTQAKHIAYGLEFDFGVPWELLECVDHYVHDIPDLTANTCWMADKIKAMALIVGRTDIADEMNPIGLKAYNKLQSLWDADAGWFRSYRGHLSYSCQVMLSILSGALSQEQINGLMARMGDFIGPRGVKSLPDYDEEFVAVSRGDFNGPASYSGTTAEFANILGFVGAKDDLYKLTKGISKWWEWRPYQPQGIDSETGYGVGLISFEGTNNCASAYMSIVPMYMVGLRPALGGVDLYDCYPSHWSNTLGKASFNGSIYSTKVSLPIKGRKITYYVDKPYAGDVHYSHASIYSAEGDFIQHWYSQRLPESERDLNIILHFDSSMPLLSGLDEITRVMEATENRYSLENRYSDIQFTVRKSASSEVSFNMSGAPSGQYRVFVNDKKLGTTITADATGSFVINYSMLEDIAHIRIKLAPASMLDLALLQIVTADSTLGSGFEPARMVDGDEHTLWSSEESELPHWVKVDLGEVKLINRVDLHWGDNFGADYKVQASLDGYNWGLVAYKPDNKVSGLHSHAFAPIEARYVRIYAALGRTGTLTIREVNVYG